MFQFSKIIFPVVYLLAAPIAFAQQATGDNEGKGGRPPPQEDTTGTSERIGDTSILMGYTAIPTSVDACDGDTGFTRLLCLSNLLISTATDEQLENLVLEYSVCLLYTSPSPRDS